MIAVRGKFLGILCVTAVCTVEAACKSSLADEKSHAQFSTIRYSICAVGYSQAT